MAALAPQLTLSRHAETARPRRGWSRRKPIAHLRLPHQADLDPGIGEIAKRVGGSYFF
jgi:hypothetical protein